MIKIHEQECLHLFALHILVHRTIPTGFSVVTVRCDIQRKWV